MEKIRFEQAQMLIKEAGASKYSEEALHSPHEGRINSHSFGEILSDLMDLEDFIYSSRPDHVLKGDDAQVFCDQIIFLREKLNDILADFGVIEKKNLENEIKSLSEKILILTTKSSVKKVMIKLGVNPQKIIVTGVPLQLDDMKKINPNIPEPALKPIEAKIKNVKNEINALYKKQYNPNQDEINKFKTIVDGLTDEENNMVLEEFEIIDKTIDLINEIEGIENVEPMTHCLDNFIYELREDEIEESENIDELLANCDDYINDEVRVPKVVE